MSDSDRATPPSTAILRAIGYAERTMMEIAMLIWPKGGQTELQGALLHAEVQRMIRAGLVEAKPFDSTKTLGSHTPKSVRRRYSLTLLGLNAYEEVAVDDIMIACESPTQPDLHTIEEI